MSELSFLIDLLLNHKLHRLTKEAIAARIKEVEENRTPVPQVRVTHPLGQVQAASTLALMAKHGEIPVNDIPIAPAPQPVAVIAQTPATAAAMQARNEAILGTDRLDRKVDQTGKKKRW